MTLGEKLKKARLERGLTQSQVCGEHITRNMLSQLENDLASPSVRTLEHLADALGVSVGWLLESDPVREKLDEARQLYRGGAYKECFLLLNCADNIGDEGVLLFIRSALQVCESALSDGRLREAEQVAAAAAERCGESLYTGSTELLRAHSVLLRCMMERGETAEELLRMVRSDCAAASQQEQCIMLTARHDLLQNDPEAALRQLQTVPEPGPEQVGEWLILRGMAYLQRAQLPEAEDELHRAESAPRLNRLQRRELYRLLEQCSREREDYRQAYFYAQRQLQLEKTEN